MSSAGSNDGADALDERLNPVRIGVIGEAHGRVVPTPGALAHVVDCGVGHPRVGHGDQRVGECANPGGAEADLLDSSLDVAHDHPVANLEGLIGQDRRAAEQILERVLGSQCDGDATDAETGDQRGDVDVEVLQDEYRADRADEDLARGPRQRNQLIVELGVGLFRDLRPIIGSSVDQAKSN